ncbi:MAG: hypothetical protein JO199_01580 [Candidatus Eremiobacteraeota bacterium]|nr:hypothetical protein [Candidatus Eremiobacteraeota bacterium]
MFHRFAAACSLAAVLAGCAGGAGPTLVPAVTAPAAGAMKARTTASLTVAFRIPTSGTPGSIGISASAAPGGKRVAGATVNAMAKAGGCGAVANGWFTCAASITAAPGTYFLSAIAYAGRNAGGKSSVLFGGFAAAVQTGTNHVAFALGGTPSTVSVALVQPNVFASGTPATGFQLGGNGKLAVQHFAVAVQDALGNAIVGPQAPALSLTTASTSQLSIAAVAGTQGRYYSVMPLAQSRGALIVTASAGTVHAKVKLTLQPILYVINCWNTTVTEYAPWSDAPIATITGYDDIGANSAMAVDSAGNLYLANHLPGAASTTGITVFAPGTTTPMRKIANVNDPQYLAVDASGDVFVNENNQDVLEFTPTGGSTPSRVLSTATSPSGIGSPYGLAVDGSGNLFVASSGIGIAEYAAGTSTTPVHVLSTGMNQPQWPAFDGQGNLYVANYAGQNVTAYAPPFTNSTPVAHTFGSSATIGQPQAIAVDGNGNVYVVNLGNQNVVEFSSAGSLVRTISGLSLSGTNLVATDTMDNAYVPNENGYGSVGIYAPGSATSASSSYTKGFSGPMDVAIWP